jgi:trehalose/maltose hydrolase-like predicted phosphorylase
MAGQAFELCAENFSGTVELACWIEGEVANTNAEEYRGQDSQHWTAVEAGSDGDMYWLRARTRGSRIELAWAAQVYGEGTRQAAPRGVVWQVSLREREPYAFEKLCALFSGRDRACREPLAQAQREVARHRFAELSASQVQSWQRAWDEFVLETPARPKLSAVLRLHAFHLLQCVPEEGLDASIGARGLHGENYRGHVFWDELFVFPVLGLRWPAQVRNLLLYRYRRLDAARQAAREAGLRGAAFPWRSASDGSEVTEPFRQNTRTKRWIPDHTARERHINAAIAYNVWRYFECTDDRAFMRAWGSELLLSIASYWASAADYDARDDRYHLRGVMGPDEFHQAYPGASEPGIDDNAYTNVMAVWCLLRALDALALLPPPHRQSLLAELQIDDAELELWERVSRRMFVPFHDGNVISQFAGFEHLAPLDLAAYARRYGDIKRIDDILDSEGDSSDRYQVCKQPDVLMLFFLHAEAELAELFARLGYGFDAPMFARNVAYYRARTSNGSTLSRVVNAWLETKLDRARSWQLLCEALGVDLTALHDAAAREGIHLGAMAGTIDVFERAYMGIAARRDRLSIDPLLPPELPELRSRVCYRDQWIDLHANQRELRVSARPEGTAAITIELAGERYLLAPGEQRVSAIRRR